MYSMKEWTLREYEIYNAQRDGKAWLTRASLKQAQQLVDLIGKSRIDLRNGKIYKGVALVDVYLKGYTYC